MNEKQIQAMIKGLSGDMQKQRADSQMTLGKLIECLRELPRGTLVGGIKNPHSYRGYYEDLAFERFEGKMRVSDAINLAQSCMGEVFHGYKGGEYQMGRNTPVWIAKYGRIGSKITGLTAEGIFTLEDDE